MFAKSLYGQLAAVAAWTAVGAAAGAAPVAFYASVVGTAYFASVKALEPGPCSFDAIPEQTEIVSKPFSNETVLMASVSVWSIVKSILADVMKKLNPWA